MAEVQWIKLTTNMFDDEKIRLIQVMPEADAIIVIWIRLLTLAGKTNDFGQIYMSENLAFTDEMLATLFSKPVNTVRLAIKTLEQFGMIEMLNSGVIFVNNWEKHQNIDGMEKMKLDNRNRQRKFTLRNKLKQLGIDPDQKGVPNHDIDELEEYVEKVTKNTNVSLTLDNALDKRREEKRRIEKNREDKKTIMDEDDFSNSVNAASFYENNGFGTISPHVKERMNGIYDDFLKIGAVESDINELIVKALSISVEQNVRKWVYAEKILLNWCNEGYKNVHDVTANEKQHNQSRVNRNGKGGSKNGGYETDEYNGLY